MDVFISSTESVEMDHSYHWTHLIFIRPYVSLKAVVDDSISLFTSMFCLSLLFCHEAFYVRDAAEVEILLPFSVQQVRCLGSVSSSHCGPPLPPFFLLASF